MSERTRLDVIVEEELNRTFYCVGGQLEGQREVCDRIAERAFRHGAEQEWKNPHRYPDSREPVPAPAQEKRCSSRVGDGHPYKPPVGICAVEGCGVPHYGHVPPAEEKSADRRKGQRRRGLEISAVLRDGARHFHFNQQTICAFPFDRRSGDDKRR
jgi:hypothetical protein